MSEDLIKGKKWSLLQDQVRKLSFELGDASDKFERMRRENITKRYLLLIEALETGYAKEQTLRYIAELGAEFGMNKSQEYCGGSPFNV